jgi:hypothetical protein
MHNVVLPLLYKINTTRLTEPLYAFILYILQIAIFLNLNNKNY